MFSAQLAQHPSWALNILIWLIEKVEGSFIASDDAVHSCCFFFKNKQL